MRDESHLEEFKKDLQCPKCLSKDIKMCLVTICGPPEYLRWEYLKCGYYSHMKTAEMKEKDN